MPIYLHIKRHINNYDEAKRALTNFFELINQKQIDPKDDDWHKVGSAVDILNYNENVQEFKERLNNIYNQFSTSTGLINA